MTMKLTDWTGTELPVEETGLTRTEVRVSFASDGSSEVEMVEVRALADLANFFWPDCDIGSPVKEGETRFVRRAYLPA